MDLINALLLGLVEGISEFLPISSTGHLLVVSALLNFPSNALLLPGQSAKDFRDTFDIFIQLGAIVAVVVYYGRDLLRQARKLPSDQMTQRFWFNILVAFVPVGVIGFLFGRQITQYLYSPLVVGLALIVGGVVLWLAERRNHATAPHSVEQITFRQAAIVGLAQIVALIPGVSRSAASIIGGMWSGLDRKAATVFSFYLAIPTLGIATIYQLLSALKEKHVEVSQLPAFGAGTLVAFAVAWLSIAWLLRYVSTHDFRAFGVYRIIVGAFVVLLALFTKALSS